MSSIKAPPSYHHGDARNALLHAAANLLEQAGAAGLSLRQVAESAGLSRQAPYNHFADKQSLLAELVREGFEQLRREVAACDRPRQKPLTRLERAGEAYIAFAQRQPALFRLMFSNELVDLSRHLEAQRAAAAAYAALAAIVGALATPGKAADATLAAWSIVHGYATLCIEFQIEDPALRRPRAALFARAIAAL